MPGKLIAGVDIGNSSTEAAIIKIEENRAFFLTQHLVRTTGIKGTAENSRGITDCLQQALAKIQMNFSDLSVVRINEAAPVIGDLAMDVISETIITESSMIGHNPDTPGGEGIGAGWTILLEQLLEDCTERQPWIVVINEQFDYEWAARKVNECTENGIEIKGLIVQKDDGVLIHNRLNRKIPIVDEVTMIEKVPLGKKAAVEVAAPGHVIRMLSNPYGLSTLFKLSPDETRQTAPIAKSLVGNRSAVVVRTPEGQVTERKIKSGSIIMIGDRASRKIDVNDGADEIMNTYKKIGSLIDVQGEQGTNAGAMLNGLRQNLSEITFQKQQEITIADLLAVDTKIPASVQGALAGEMTMESGVALASMVKTERTSIQALSSQLEKELGVTVEIGGVEAEMAITGALTTPGTESPIVILDMGGGSTDAATTDRNGAIRTVHLAGAGDMVTMLINTELALQDAELAEKIKKFPLGKVQSVFHMQLEDGGFIFSETAFPPETFGKVVIKEGSELIPLPLRHSMEQIRAIRREAKRKVFVTNAVRALELVIPTGNIRHISFVAMLGGSALDFEIPEMINDELSKYGIVSGFANIRGTEGPRNAVATGLVLSYGNGCDYAI